MEIEEVKEGSTQVEVRQLPPTEETTLDNCLDAVLLSAAKCSSKVVDWDFNVFELAKDTGFPLATVTLAALKQYNLLDCGTCQEDSWLVDPAKAVCYLLAVERGYHENPYHNNVHAADVTQTTAVILHHSDLALSPVEIFAVLLSAAVHDLGHPGLTNDFLINTLDPRAVTYNNRSVNENYHASQAFRLALQSEEHNIFAGLSTSEFKMVRELVIAMVLSTDMAIHFELLERFNIELSKCADISKWQDKSLALQMIVHLADLANPARAFPLAKIWAERVTAEFLHQGDREADLGLPITPACDRSTISVPKSQRNFITLFLKPTLESMRPLCSWFVSMALQNLEITYKEWSELDMSTPLQLQNAK